MCLAPFELPAPCNEATADMPESPDESGSDMLPSLELLPEERADGRGGAAAADADPVAAAAAEPVWHAVSAADCASAGLGKICGRRNGRIGRNAARRCGVSYLVASGARRRHVARLTSLGAVAYNGPVRESCVRSMNSRQAATRILARPLAAQSPRLPTWQQRSRRDWWRSLFLIAATERRRLVVDPQPRRDRRPKSHSAHRRPRRL